MLGFTHSLIDCRVSFQERMFQFWFNTYFVNKAASGLKNGSSAGPGDSNHTRAAAAATPTAASPEASKFKR